jgi:hypothetical protein
MNRSKFAALTFQDFLLCRAVSSESDNPRRINVKTSYDKKKADWKISPGKGNCIKKAADMFCKIKLDSLMRHYTKYIAEGNLTLNV